MSEMKAVGVDTFEAAISGTIAGLTLKASQTLDPRPKRTVLIAPGANVAHDNCCDQGGQVWGRLVNIGPTPGTDPRQKHGLDACKVPSFLLTLELGIIRCAAVVNDRGQAPSELQVTADGEQSIKDMAALLGVLRCDPKIRGVLGWTPTGPEGGCHGGVWTFTALVSNCIQCEEIPEGEDVTEIEED